MKITLLSKGQPIGYVEYDIINEFELMGKLGPIFTQPSQLGNVILQKIKKNKDVVVSGGFAPQDLSQYFDGVVLVLESIKSEVPSFDYHIPEKENPYLLDAPEEIQKRVS